MAYTSPSIVASGTTFAQFQGGGPSGHLEKLIAAQVATADPTVAPTLSAAGTGGTLPAATYAVRVSETNGIGETLSIAAAATQAVTLGQTLTVTFQSLKSGNTARNVYVSAVGTSGPWTLAGTGITASTLAISAPLPTNSLAGVALPVSNTTALTYTDANGTTINLPLVLARSVEAGKFQAVYQFLGDLIDNFNRGEPMAFTGTVMKLRHAHTAYSLLATLCAEMGTLIDANPGTVNSVSTLVSGAKQKRSWP